jgi:radical SAM modification target selenobiotic family peptide
MDVKELRKILTGMCVATLFTGAGVAVGGAASG